VRLENSEEQLTRPEAPRGRRARERVIAAARSAGYAIAVPLLASAVALVAWQYASGTIINQLYISKPTIIWSAFWKLVENGQLSGNLPVTLEEAVYGFIVGSVIAVPVALMHARIRLLLRASSPIIIGLYCVPRMALGPLFIVWFGIGVNMKVWLAASLVFFPMYFTAYSGAQSIDASYLHSARLMGASRRQIFWHIALPSMMTWLFVGIRQALPFALAGAVVGEIIVANRGMGYLLEQAASYFDTSQLMAVLFVIAALGYLANSLLGVIEKIAFRWKGTAENVGGFRGGMNQ
jgi:NitT/TauT family transport system permease protein